LKKVLEEIISTLSLHYAHIGANKKFVTQTIFEEMQQFQSTLVKGEKKYEELLAQQK